MLETPKVLSWFVFKPLSTTSPLGMIFKPIIPNQMWHPTTFHPSILKSLLEHSELGQVLILETALTCLLCWKWFLHLLVPNLSHFHDYLNSSPDTLVTLETCYPSFLCKVPNNISRVILSLASVDCGIKNLLVCSLFF